ncbi:MAG: C4-dicarboxylate TRAP transporter substrate-binding protein, partial [Burkholderiales bacterium]
MRFARIAAAVAVFACALHAGGIAQAEDIRLRIASGHPPVQTYVNLMTTYFVPEVTKRVAARTKHKVEFVEAYGGSIVKVADVLEGVQ